MSNIFGVCILLLLINALIGNDEGIVIFLFLSALIGAITVLS